MLDPSIESLKTRFRKLNKEALELSEEASQVETYDAKGLLLFVFVVGHGVTHNNQQCLRLAGEPDGKRNPFPIE